MALLTWNDSYSVKVRQFDDQHKKLVEMINSLHDAMKVGKGRETMDIILKSLIDYTKTHFADEERLMTQHQFPGYEKHKKEHNLLTIQAQEINKQLEAGTFVVSQELLTFLREWLVKHIQGEDKQYGPFLNGKGIA